MEMTKADAMCLAISCLIEDGDVEPKTKVNALVHLIPELRCARDAEAAYESPAAPMRATNTPPVPTAEPQVKPTAASAKSASVPLSQTPTVTKQQVASAGAALIQKDPAKKDPLLALLKLYGVPSVADLAEENLGSFATELRELGADI